MKIGIFTFHCAANYGAVLQTYCLQEVLKDMGHEVYVINYRPKYLTKPYKIFQYDSTYFGSNLARYKGFLRACLVTPIRCKRNRVFSQFIRHHLNLYPLDLNDKSNDFDAFIFGSDQIWNPKITNGFDSIYLGDFPAAREKKLIAYAASAGSISNFSGEDTDYFLSRLQCFDQVTVREKSLAEYINQKTSISSEVVFDPVLLAGPTVLHKLLNDKIKEEQNQKQPYLFLFQLVRNDGITFYAASVAKSKGLKLIEVATMCESPFNNNMKQTLSVEQLLSYFINAAYIITSSFHGTVLSILFNKQFNTISVNDCIDERALSLLRELHLSDRMLNIYGKTVSPTQIDYTSANNLYDCKKIESFNILHNILSCH